MLVLLLCHFSLKRFCNQKPTKHCGVIAPYTTSAAFNVDILPSRFIFLDRRFILPDTIYYFVYRLQVMN